MGEKLKWKIREQIREVQHLVKNVREEVTKK